MMNFSKIRSFFTKRKKIVLLDNELNTPQFWVNFVNSLPSTLTDEGIKAHVKAREEELCKYHCGYESAFFDTPVLWFDTEEEATMFVLKWS